ncbi:MAG: hypothetical protein LBJ67_00040, partial [Planctomycetaceae bacterium]|nr:hypothetical protein [Planctomycetaceae bacterium]
MAIIIFSEKIGYLVVPEKFPGKISSSRSYQPHVHFVRKPSGIARRIRKNQLETGRFAVSL